MFTLLQPLIVALAYFRLMGTVGGQVNNYLSGDGNAEARFDPRIFARSFDLDRLDLPEAAEYGDFSCQSFKIRAADSSGERSSASVLIEKMYATRGYASSPLPDEQRPNLMTLVASNHSETIGTLTVGFDSPAGLLADDLFGGEIDELRRAGRKVCEFTKLAIDSPTHSKPVLAALFNLAYIYAHQIRGVDDLLIEVNPRHVRYYAAMLGFKVVGPKRLNKRVNAPAVLLSLDFDYVRRNIAEFGGRPELAKMERSLYPFSFSAREEAGIINRLRRRFCSEPQRRQTHRASRQIFRPARQVHVTGLSAINLS